jgi:hypothetical protein
MRSYLVLDAGCTAQSLRDLHAHGALFVENLPAHRALRLAGKNVFGQVAKARLAEADVGAARHEKHGGRLDARAAEPRHGRRWCGGRGGCWWRRGGRVEVAAARAAVAG